MRNQCLFVWSHVHKLLECFGMHTYVQNRLMFPFPHPCFHPPLSRSVINSGMVERPRLISALSSPSSSCFHLSFETGRVSTGTTVMNKRPACHLHQQAQLIHIFSPRCFSSLRPNMIQQMPLNGIRHSITVVLRLRCNRPIYAQGIQQMIPFSWTSFFFLMHVILIRESSFIWSSHQHCC